MLENNLENNPSNYIATYSGKVINPLDPDPDQIEIIDIAHALSNQCRFTGHVTHFYSVAEHSCRVAQLLDQQFPELDVAWAGLLHDASEAYLSDIARPVKRHKMVSSFYDEIEDKLMQVISEKFGFSWPIQAQVKWADDVLLRSEQRDLMPDVYIGDFRLRLPGEDYLSYKIEPWLPNTAQGGFLHWYTYLQRRR